MMVRGETVNKEIELIKADLTKTANDKLQNTLNEVKMPTGDDKKDTSTKQKYLTPPVKPTVATYFFDNNVMLAKGCNILGEDLILGNKINIKIKEEVDGNTNTENIDISNIIRSVEESHVEIYNMCIDYYLNGAGCCKVHKFGEVNGGDESKEVNEFRLTQLPMESLQVMKVVDEKLQATPIYLVEQDLGGGTKNYFKIVGSDYPDSFDSYENYDLGLCWWIGGDNFYKFFRKPVWLQAREAMSAQIAIESLDTQKINSGNNVNGVLYFNKQSSLTIPQIPSNETDNADESENNNYYEQLKQIAEQSGAQTIANELKAAGVGTAVLYEETRNPMTMDYVKISDDNYQYLLEKSKAADQKVMSSFSIPRERYMINDIKESMNSNKSATFWEIYTKSIPAQQLLFEKGLLNVINECYNDLNFELTIDIEVPMFSELINAKIKTYTILFLNALITLKQTIILLSQYITNLNIEDHDFTQPIYEMRFFNGKPLGDYDLNPDEKAKVDTVMNTLNNTDIGESNV